MKSLLTLIILLGMTQVYGFSIDSASNSLHRVQTIESGTAALALRLDMIDRATKSIDVEYFIYDTSLASRIFTEALIRKKINSPEIQIRIIVDYFELSKSLSPYEAWALKEHDIEVKHYNPANILNLANVTSRNHRKIIAIDNSEAIIGSRNMADEYFDLNRSFNFSDRDLWIKGPIVKEITRSFDDFWNFKKTIIPKKPKKPVRRNGDDRHYHSRKRNFLKKSAHAKAFTKLFNPEDEEDSKIIQLRESIIRYGLSLLEDEPVYKVSDVRFIADGADWKQDDHGLTGKAFFDLMSEAKNEILIEVPYFYLQKNEERFFENLKLNNVQVDLLINSKKASNEFAINYITLLEGMKFSKMGFNVHLNQGKFFNFAELPSANLTEKTIWGVHAKTLIVDDNHTWIGTLNMDPRSVQRLNSELAVVINDRPFTDRVKKHISLRLSEAREMHNGKLSDENIIEKDPSKLEGFLEYMARMKTFPLYIFENQI